jgi:hypothetical protein
VGDVLGDREFERNFDGPELATDRLGMEKLVHPIHYTIDLIDDP